LLELFEECSDDDDYDSFTYSLLNALSFKIEQNTRELNEGEGPKVEPVCKAAVRAEDNLPGMMDNVMRALETYEELTLEKERDRVSSLVAGLLWLAMCKHLKEDDPTEDR